MASKVILHIGQQKSGTTFLQEVLGHIEESLAEETGILFPASIRTILPDAVENHERATSGLLGTEYPWISEARAADERGKWLRLIATVREWPGTVLISAEALSTIRPAAVARFLTEFGDAGIEVVITTRALDRSLPSLWQQHLRNGRVSTIEEFFDLLVRQRECGPEAIEERLDLHVWRAFALGRLVRRWAAAVGTDRISVVINPGSPDDLLWRRFAAAIGAGSCVDLPPAEVRSRRTHSGLTRDEAQLMIALNRAVAKAGWSTYEGRALRADILAHGLLPRAGRGGRITVPETARRQVAAWAEEDIAELRASGVRVVGELDELRHSPEHEDVQPPVTPEQVAEAAAAAIMAVLPSSLFAEVPQTTTWPKRLRSRL